MSKRRYFTRSSAAAAAAGTAKFYSKYLEMHSQDYAQALKELRAGQKESHWIWYILPQLAGQSTSAMARRFDLQSLAECKLYLAEPTLRAHYVEAVAAIYSHRADIKKVMGSQVDFAKLVSSLTLFSRAASDLLESREHSPLHKDLRALVSLSTRLLQACYEQGAAPSTYTLAKVT